MHSPRARTRTKGRPETVHSGAFPPANRRSPGHSDMRANTKTAAGNEKQGGWQAGRQSVFQLTHFAQEDCGGSGQFAGGLPHAFSAIIMGVAMARRRIQVTPKLEDEDNNLPGQVTSHLQTCFFPPLLFFLVSIYCNNLSRLSGQSSVCLPLNPCPPTSTI